VVLLLGTNLLKNFASGSVEDQKDELARTTSSDSHQRRPGRVWHRRRVAQTEEERRKKMTSSSNGWVPHVSLRPNRYLGQTGWAT
jgi:hypothetical protein